MARSLAATPEEPQYLIFWLDSSQMAELSRRIGTQGDGRSRLLGFGVSLPTFEAEATAEERIRSAFRVARESGLAVHLHFDSHLAWRNRPDLWNWFDPAGKGYNAANAKNVEWSDWKGTANRGRYINWGQPERIAPHMCYNSAVVRREITRLVSTVLGPVLRAEIAALEQQRKGHLFAGITVGSEPGIDDYTSVDEATARLMKRDGAPRVRLGYCALTNRGFSAENPPEDFTHALAEVNQEFLAFWARQFVQAGIMRSRLYTHVAAPAAHTGNAPIWVAFNQDSRPGWTTYPVQALGRGFMPIYEELEKRGNPSWGGVEANGAFGGVTVPWEEYLARHFNHGARLVAINSGATSPQLSDELERSTLGNEAIAAYRRFLTGQPLRRAQASAAAPATAPAVDAQAGNSTLQAKVARVAAGVRAWRDAGRDPTAVARVMEQVGPLVEQGKWQEAEALVDQALAMLGDTSPGISASRSAVPSADTGSDTQYLVFQLFTYMLDGSPKFDRAKLAGQVSEIIQELGGLRGDGKKRQLGFAVGPLTLDQTDTETQEVIRAAFQLAEERGLAVAIHLDDSMFWMRRSDLWRKPENVEWTDWKKTVHPQRYVDWVGVGVKLAPQMCLNSREIRAEISRYARQVVGREVKRQVDGLRARGKEHLFAGVIAGWETHLADYSDQLQPDLARRMEADGVPRARIGYCALSNLGFSASNPPQAFREELERVVYDFATFWVRELQAAGVPRERLYTHFMIPDRKAFNAHSRPGFSLYTSGHVERAYAELGKHGNPRWGMAEGTNLDAGMLGLSWESYLASMFNHGASLVTVFAWHEKDRSPYGKATRSADAIAAYKNFLRGAKLTETRSTLHAKVERIRRQLGDWIRRSGKQQETMSLVEKMQKSMAEEDLRGAEAVADQILEMMK